MYSSQKNAKMLDTMHHHEHLSHACPGEVRDPIDLTLHPRHQRRVVGHEGVLRTLGQAYWGGSLPHAMVFVGPKGVGKSTLAWHIAKHLLLDLPAGQQGFSPQFQGKQMRAFPTILNLTHPDLWCAEAALKGSDAADETGVVGQTIGVEVVRSLTKFLSQARVGGGARVVVVDALDAMNKYSLNALLKSLEEPPPCTYFFLVAHQMSALLPTIRSRCQVFRCNPLPRGDMAPLLQALSLDGAVGALAEQSGSLGVVSQLRESSAMVSGVLDLLNKLVIAGREARNQPRQTGQAPMTTWVGDLATFLKKEQLARYVVTRYLQAGVAAAAGISVLPHTSVRSENERSENEGLGSCLVTPQAVTAINLETWLNLWDKWSALDHDVAALSLDWYAGLHAWLHASGFW